MTEDAMWPRIADVPPLREISLDFCSTLTEHHGLKYEMLMVPIPSQLLPMDTKGKHWVILCGSITLVFHWGHIHLFVGKVSFKAGCLHRFQSPTDPRPEFDFFFLCHWFTCRCCCQVKLRIPKFGKKRLELEVLWMAALSAKVNCNEMHLKKLA